MPTFGFSAFLKLLSLNERPQRTAIRYRLRPSEGGYDYHRSLRLRATRFLVGGETLADVLASCEEITTCHEREAAQAALIALGDWRAEKPGEILGFSPLLYESPEAEFKVHFTADFGLRIRGRRTAIHIYNTQVPLVPRMTYAALGMAAQAPPAEGERPDDWGVLALRERRLYLLSEAGFDAQAFGSVVADALDRLVREIREDLRLPPPGAGDRHPPP